jgi:hypothetical protein
MSWTGIAPAHTIQAPGIRLLGNFQFADGCWVLSRRARMKTCGAVFALIPFTAKNMLLIDRRIGIRPVRYSGTIHLGADRPGKENQPCQQYSEYKYVALWSHLHYKNHPHTANKKSTRSLIIKKFQITKNKYQTNHNDQNSKFQTIGFWSYLRFGY